tara:strand:- start:283 stop:612 length:330 start_codon:yes stop_codon:yes gene_type:complete
MYISITGIKVKSFFKMLKFMRYTVPSFTAARKASGNLFCESRKINKYHHTLTAWQNRYKMMDFLRGKHHSSAMKNFRSLGTGSVYGYEDDNIPSWEDAIKRWKENFKEI